VIGKQKGQLSCARALDRCEVSGRRRSVASPADLEPSAEIEVLMTLDQSVLETWRLKYTGLEEPTLLVRLSVDDRP
jgi:hypothetical protein